MFTVRSAFPLPQNFIRTERVVGNPDIAAVTGHIELAIVRAYVRSDRNACHIVIFPVEHVGRHPCAATSAEHVVFAFPFEDTDVS